MLKHEIMLEFLCYKYVKIVYISKRLGCMTIYDLAGKEIKGKYNVKKTMYEKSMYVHEAIAIPIIMQTRLSKPETIKFRSDSGFNKINLTLKRTISSNTTIK